MATAVATTDLADQQWLDERIDSIATSFEDMAKGIEDIRQNWTEGRNLQRLHPGVSAGEYIKDKVPWLLRSRAAVEALVQYTDYSLNAIARLTGYTRQGVSNIAAETLPAEVVGRQRRSLTGTASGFPSGGWSPSPQQTPQQQRGLAAFQARIKANTPSRTHIQRLRELHHALEVVGTYAPDIDALMQTALAIGEARKFRALTADAQTVIDAIDKTTPKNP